MNNKEYSTRETIGDQSQAQSQSLGVEIVFREQLVMDSSI